MTESYQYYANAIEQSLCQIEILDEDIARLTRQRQQWVDEMDHAQQQLDNGQYEEAQERRRLHQQMLDDGGYTETVTDTVTGVTYENVMDADGWTVSSTRRPDHHGNVQATEGCTFCWCGAKYWENDVCVSCGHAYHPDMDRIQPHERDGAR